MISREDILRRSIIEWIKQSDTSNPEISEALEILERCWASANSEIEMALQRNSVSFDTLVNELPSKIPFQTGCASLGAGDFDEAADSFTDCILEDPSNADALLMRASTYIKDRNYEGAIADCEKVLSMDPKNARAHTKKVIALLENLNYDEAQKAHQQALENCPDDDTLKGILTYKQ